MKIGKKIITIAAIMFVCSVFVGNINYASAQPHETGALDNLNSAGTEFLNSDSLTKAKSSTYIGSATGRLVQNIVGLVGMVFLIMTIVGGIMYMSSGGNEETIDKAKGILRHGIIGLMIVITAGIIVAFVDNVLSKSTGISLTINKDI